MSVNKADTHSATPPWQRAATAIRSPRRLPFLLLIVAVALAGFLFAWWPSLDSNVTRLFYGGDGRFPADGALGRLARSFGEYFPLSIAAAMALAFLARRLLPAFSIGPSGRGLAFVLLSLALGPGLLVNTVLKDHSHRPRPRQTVEFGGKDAFRPFYRFDGACARNCSFVSGEASSAVWTVAPAMLVPVPWRPVAVTMAFGFGAAVGLLRMAFGHHFLSDVVFALLFTILVILGVYRALGLDRRSG
jgi:membrane-associated PAP2 superfamily phosphatase